LRLSYYTARAVRHPASSAGYAFSRSTNIFSTNLACAL